jgi:hypothetical protein
MFGGQSHLFRPEGPSARMGAAGSPAKPRAADAVRPAFEGHEGEAFVHTK